MKRKLLASLIATSVVVGAVQVSVFAAETDGQENNKVEVAQSELNSELDDVTTPAAVVIKIGTDDTTTSAAVTIEEQVVDINKEYSTVKKVINNFKVTNDTTEQDIINAAKNSVDSTVSIKFGAEEGQAFTKINSTIEVKGNIKGTIIISNGTESEEIELNLDIPQLVQKDNIVKTLSAEYTTISKDNILALGKTSVIVKGYNAAGVEVSLDETKLTYKWQLDKKIISEDKEIDITEEMRSKQLTCIVDYPDDI